MNPSYQLINGGESITVVGSTAAIANWVTPKPARLAKSNINAGTDLQGGALVVVGVSWNLTGESVGYVVNMVHGTEPTTTALWTFGNSNADLSGSFTCWRPLVGPTISAGNAVNGGRLALALIGTPSTGCWIRLECIHHHDVTYRGTNSGTGAAVVFTG